VPFFGGNRVIWRNLLQEENFLTEIALKDLVGQLEDHLIAQEWLVWQEIERERETDRQTETYLQTEKDRGRQETERQGDKERETETQRKRERGGESV
jgi:hypothetical protein